MRTLREHRGRNKKDEIQQNKTLQREEKTRERDTERDTNERVVQIENMQVRMRRNKKEHDQTRKTEISTMTKNETKQDKTRQMKPNTMRQLRK